MVTMPRPAEHRAALPRVGHTAVCLRRRHETKWTPPRRPSEPRNDAPQRPPLRLPRPRARKVRPSRRAAHLTLRLTSDPQFLLAVAIALPVLAVEGTYQLALPWLAVAVPVGYV